MKKLFLKSFLLFSFFSLNILKCPDGVTKNPVLPEKIIHPWQDHKNWAQNKAEINELLRTGKLTSLKRMGADKAETGRNYQFSTDVYMGILEGNVNGINHRVPVVFKTGYDHVERARMDAFAHNLSSELTFPPVTPAVYKEHIEITPELKAGLISHPDGRHLEDWLNNHNNTLEGSLQLFVPTPEDLMQKDFSQIIKDADPKELALLAYFYHLIGILLAGRDNVLRTSDGTLIPIDFGNVQCMGFHSKEQSLDYGKPTWIAMPVPLEDQAKLPTLNDTGSFPFDAGAMTFKNEEGKPSIKDQVKAYFGESLSDKFYTDNDARFNGDSLTLCPYKGYLYRRSIMFDNPDIAKNYILPFSDTRNDQALRNLRNLTYPQVLKAFTQTGENANPETFYTGPDYLEQIIKRAESIVDYFDRKRDAEIRDYYLERNIESEL